MAVKNARAQGQWIVMATYVYDDQGRLVTATDADGFSSRYAYDELNRLVTDTDRSGLAFHFVYDDRGRCIESWGDYPGRVDPSLTGPLPAYLYDGRTRAKGIHHCRFDYGPDRYTEVADSTQVRRFFGTEHGTLEKRVEGGAVMTATYRDDGHILSRTDAMGHTTRFERDERGRLLRVTDPLGRVTSIERDAAGRPITITDPAGGETRFERDTRGNVVRHVDPAGGSTSFRYDECGLVQEIVDTRGARTSFSYDDQGNRVSVQWPNGATWRYAHDALGRRIAAADPLGAETRYAYSPRGDILSVYDAAGGTTRYAYNGERHLVQTVDPNGGITRLVWGGYHKLCARVDANGNEVRLAYNLEGELVEVRNERGEVHRLVYDPAGRLIEERTFDGRHLLYKNDLLGRPIEVTNGLGQRAWLTYDAAGQLVNRELADGESEQFEYDERGAVVCASSAGCDVRFVRDALGRVVREEQVVEGTEIRIESAYDPEGNRVRRTTSLGHLEAIERDGMGSRRRTVLDGNDMIEHGTDLLGREIARSLPGGGRIESAFDAMGRLSQRKALGAAARRQVGPGQPEWIGPQIEDMTVARAYRYDAVGELVERWDLQEGRTSFRYDPAGQLLARTPEKARAEVFRYDSAGNLYEEAERAAPVAYGSGNRLLRKGQAAYVWDDNGRLLEKRMVEPGGTERVFHYTWSEAGLLASVRTPDGRLVEFSYDAFARRVLKSVSRLDDESGRRSLLSATRFVWDGDKLVHEIMQRAREAGDPVVAARTYCFEDETFAPLAHCESQAGVDGRSERKWIHYVNDPIGTPDRLLQADGQLACDLRRSAWGETQVAQGSRASTPIRFQGQYEDAETGLCYNRFRYYDPDTGMFIRADPIGLAGGMHGFRYAPNTTRWRDPLGLARYPDSLSGRRNPNQDAIIKMAEAEERRAVNEARACGGAVTPRSKGEVDSMVQWANEYGVPVRAKNKDISGAHGWGPVSPTPHIHINGAHVPVPPGYRPPSGSTIITDSGPTTIS
ncbi:RHS repeat-associated core domain-containing protein [Sorangium sp. So ce1182]|uniref:RHS repeat-associated core domain-containing protein n=1 Tax=Sorangium sp. So ce1182 TaxID=3133334 RepID=UPI003F5E7A5C